MPDEQVISGPTRNPDGTFPKGVSGNPSGRPVFSVVTILKEYLQEVPEGEKRTRAKQLVEEIVTKAVVDKDTAMMRDILDRVDGKPKQAMEHSGTGENGALEVVIRKM